MRAEASFRSSLWRGHGIDEAAVDAIKKALDSAPEIRELRWAMP